MPSHKKEIELIMNDALKPKTTMNEEILKELERYIDEETNGSYKVDALIAKKVVDMAVTAKDLEYKKILEEEYQRGYSEGRYSMLEDIND